MPKPFDMDALDALDAIAELRSELDAALGRYTAVEGELTKHRNVVEALETRIDALLSELPADVAAQAKQKSKRSKPWE